MTTQSENRRRSTDATRITFPLQLVLLICGGIVATSGAFWLATSTMRTDIAVIRQSQHDQSQIDEMKTKLDEANRRILQQGIDGLQKAIDQLNGQEKLNTIEIGNVRREMNDRSLRR